MADDNPRIHLGANNPPVETSATTPFEAVKVHAEDLIVEALAWCDGSAIENQAQADDLSRLMDDLRKANAAAEAQRKLEAKVWDDGKAEVQARYKPLQTRLETAVATCKAGLTPWLAKLEDEKRAVADEARRVAEVAAEAARVAMQSAAPTDLGAREEAEGLLKVAKAAEKAAGAAAKDKAHAVGGDRAVGLRSYWTPVLMDGVIAARHYWETDRAAIEGFVLTLAERDVHMGKRQLPGFDVREDRRVV